MDTEGASYRDTAVHEYNLDVIKVNSLLSTGNPGILNCILYWTTVST